MLSLQKKNFLIISLFIFSLSFTGCVSSKKLALRNTKTKIESKLGIEIGNRDDLDLFVECANWVGAPYKLGGTTKNGVDCSGFTTSVYRVVYDKSLERSSADIYKKNCRRVYKRSLKSGDLVFFRPGRFKKINHVGIYLKDGKFIHSATRGGVRVDDLSDQHYKNVFYRGGRVVK